jgi:hypothetical protein
MKEKTTQMGLRVGVLFTLVLLLPVVAAQGPPVDEQEECLAYAYTSSENHLFLLGNNVSMFGSRLIVIHNCDNLEIYLDGFFEMSSGSNMALTIDQGIHNITFQANGFNSTFENVVFYPDRLDWEYQYQIIEQSKPEFIDIEISELRTNWAVGVGIVIVWVLTTYVYWQMISSYVDRNFIEEVVQ